MQAYFGRAKAACLCSYCCNRHLCYDGGRLGTVKIVTLRVAARAKEEKRGGGGEKALLLTRPIFSPLFEFQHALSRAKHSRARRKRLLCRLRVTSRLDWQNNNSARGITPFCIFLCRHCTTATWKHLLNFTLCGGRKLKTTTFFFFSWTSIHSFRIQLQIKNANIWRIERGQ